MLAPLRDHLSPKDPKSSPLLCMTKEHYFTRMSVVIDPDKPDFEETQWIMSEDINVEHLLDVFSTTDTNSDSVWAACANFMQHLFWHKGRLTVLKAKIEGLSDEHHRKPECLFELSRLFASVGNHVERRRLLSHVLKLERERGDDGQVARTLRTLSDSNRLMGLPKEGIQQAKEALEIYERLSDTVEQAWCLITLAWSLRNDKQLDAAEEAASRAIDLLPEKGKQFRVCQSHRVLGEIYRSKGDIGKAIHHFEMALEIASSFNWHDQLFWVHYSLAGLSFLEGRFDDASVHLEHARSHAVNRSYNLGRAMHMQALVWHGQHKLEEARSEALRAAGIFEKLGDVEGLERCRGVLRQIGGRTNDPVALYLDGEL